MKRRNFLGLIGATVAAPFLPAGAGMATTPVAAAYNRYTFGLAVFHARTRAHVSARGLAHCLRVSLPQAEAMIAEMSGKGLVTPVLGGPAGKVRAVSNILKDDVWGLKRTAQRNQSARQRSNRVARDADHQRPKGGADLSLFVAHLRGLAARHFAATTVVTA